ncbi:uncharacterized protein LOC127445516 isoform X1 [Myxocyprinus asiaticus]|uniref:uncharacterized protein LOC127445516 isoform X1 n=1 Tax=Myxocyprinus asiaticus TaxID=70543 RepID=UPI002223CA4E|nr:uncharacterized protein LOC127445516 isoform X1 [Myxocyprinus asiaticus]XP_051561621.1 uncharacterized protein LOC127445516 isoform X1 [Myxocyprinus asiaticus]
MVRRIKTISELEGSGFGRPCPRHGLKLLFWFADYCICYFNDDMFLQCDPVRGDYGFHFFENRRNKHKVKLLPDVNFPYYVVGNMNYPGADMLPDYVVEDYTYCRDDNSNADRIIVSVHEGNRFGKVYMTTHNDLSNYDPRATFHITRTLLKIIKSYLNIDDFLRDTGYHPQYHVEISNQPVSPSPLRYYDPDCHIDMESPNVSNSSTDIMIENDASSQNSENLTRKKGLCERFCTIL